MVAGRAARACFWRASAHFSAGEDVHVVVVVVVVVVRVGGETRCRRLRQLCSSWLENQNKATCARSSALASSGSSMVDLCANFAASEREIEAR